MLLRQGADINLEDAAHRSVTVSSVGEVQRLVGLKLKMYPHKYFLKPEFTLRRSFEMSAYYYLHFGLFLVALHFIGWVTALSLFGIGTSFSLLPPPSSFHLFFLSMLLMSCRSVSVAKIGHVAGRGREESSVGRHGHERLLPQPLGLLLLPLP